MDKSQTNGKILLALSLCILVIMILSFSVTISHVSVFAASDFEIEAKINLQELNDPAKMKVVASPNGDTQVKNITGNILKSKSITVSFRFSQKNDFVRVDDIDEFFMCAYDFNARTNEIKFCYYVECNIGNTG